ncbi:MAG: DNA polymerase III subunit alpha, partial [Candidatus Cloacimonetes bacterium]|nr:DNA polymerase III subunit alpha [Candidatus Cloacimonadota bacterium]
MTISTDNFLSDLTVINDVDCIVEKSKEILSHKDEIEPSSEQVHMIAPVDLNAYASLHSHSSYSLLDGLASPEKIAQTAKAMGLPAVALTDHGTCAGLYRFFKACKKESIKPILGMEAYCVENMDSFDKNENKWHLTVWAKNRQGYQNLIALSSKGWCEGFYGKPRIDLGVLNRLKDGLMIGSGCAVGMVCGPIFRLEDVAMAERNAEKLRDIFGDDFYMEVMRHNGPLKSLEGDKARIRKAMDDVYSLSVKMGIKPVIACDSHYCLKEEAEAHDVLLSIQTKNTIKNPRRFSFNSSDFYMKSPKEVVSLCGKESEMITNSIEVASKVEEDLIEVSNDLLPEFSQPGGFATQEEYLRFLIKTGLEKRGLFSKQEYLDRVEFELKVIKNCGYLKYFLILHDLVSHAKRKGIRTGPGRGSGVASLCLYCLGVTALDPIKYNLMFERFLNPDRISPPDVDIDFDHDRQGDIFEYIADKYGRDCIARIGTYNSLKAKDAVKRVGKALDIGGDWEKAGDKGRSGSWKSGKGTLDAVDSISKAIPDGPEVTIKSALEESSDLNVYYQKYPKVFSMASMLQGTLSSSGVHPSGIVICKDPVVRYSPLRRAKDGSICTQYDMVEVEELGMLKFDILALNTLTTIEKTMMLIKDLGEEFDINAIDPDSDPEIFAMLRRGDVDGVFQFEGSHGIKRLLSDMHVDCFEDMISSVALYRPGPLENGMHTKYCQRKLGKEKVNFPHPVMESVLKNTYGIMIYQEQTMEVAKKFAGFSNGDADVLRKAIGKKKADLIGKVSKMFIDGSLKQGHSRALAESVWKLIETFGGYGFNRSHAAAYALLAYQTAYLKCKFPKEFFCALLSTEKDDDKRIRYENSANKYKR